MTEAVHDAHRSCVCPWWLMQFFDHRVRALFQPTAPVVESLVAPGSLCLDMGCGMGYFSVPMALLAGSTGHVTGVDIQSRMLEGAARRAKQEGLAERISLRLVSSLRSRFNMTDCCGILCHALCSLPFRAQAWR